MCLYVDDDSYTVLGDPGWHKARKEHECRECRRVIDPGERYWSYVSVSVDDGFVVIKMCGHCYGTIEMGCALTGCHPAWWWDKVHDLDDESGFVGDIIHGHDLSQADRYRMLRSVAGRRKQWRRRDGSLVPVPAAPPKELVTSE